MSNNTVFGSLDHFNTISLKDMDNVRLMDRVDTKYVTTADKLSDILEEAREWYMVMENEGNIMHVYESKYYDTVSMEMYMVHHAGKSVRYKIRTRSYLDTGQDFLEIKKKDNHSRSIKKRIRICDPSAWLTDKDSISFISDSSPYAASRLAPSLNTMFRRITLVDRMRTERITIDADLNFHNMRTGISESLEDMLIIEVKRDSHGTSKMQSFLKDGRIHPYRISKYCIGCALTDPDIKQNRFKEKTRYIDKLRSNHIPQC